MKLYKWQEECLQAWQNNHYHGIVHVVTGAGKTIFALSAARQLDQTLHGELHIKIVVPVLALVKGWSNSIHNFFPFSDSSDSSDVGIFTGERKDSLHHKIMIYTVQSARYHLARHIYQDVKNGHPVLLIADECHHYSSPENRKIFDFLKQPDFPYTSYYSLGLSATPQAALHYSDVCVPALGKEIYHYSYVNGVKDKTVSDFFVYQIALSFSPEELHEYDALSQKLVFTKIKLYQTYPFLKELPPKEFFPTLKRLAETDGEDSPAAAFILLSYQRQRLTGDAASRIDCTLELISMLHCSERILIFSEKIIQAESIYHALNETYPNQVGLYHSDMHRDTRRTTLENFKNGITRIIVSCKALDEGIDVPDATVGIILSGTSVSRQRIQRLGRILRKNKDKPSACLYYLYIKESSEDSAFLPDQLRSVQICNLSYSATDHVFRHITYENAAAKLLEHFCSKNLSQEQLTEMRDCLMQGLVRSDWLLPVTVLETKVQQSTDTRVRNYWHCMKLLATK